jgi:vacuolar protein sorting-associated protein 45
MLYALRFEGSSSNSLPALLEILRQRKMSNRQIESVNTLLRYAGARKRQNDLFGNKSAVEMTKRFIKGLKSVENVYTQHEPYIMQILEQLHKGKLSEIIFGASELNSLNTHYDNVIVFIIGGATFEESTFIHGYNEKRLTNPGLPRVVLASTAIHNTKTFIEQLIQLTPDSQAVPPFASIA